MNSHKFTLPECGIYVGHAVYNQFAGILAGNGPAFTTWMDESTSPLEYVDLTVAENQGNLIQFWWDCGNDVPLLRARYYALEDIGIKAPEPDFINGKNLSMSEFPEWEKYKSRAGAGVLKAIRHAREKGIYTQLIYCEAADSYAKELEKEAPWYIGYNYGEKYTLGNIYANDESEIPLDVIAEKFCEQVHADVTDRKKRGWGLIFCTGCNFCLDYEVSAGVDVTMYEDNLMELNFISALSRGVHKQYHTPAWGSHIANEHYTWLSFHNPHRFDTLRMQMYLKYIAGAKIILSESGGWFVQTSADHSPMMKTPRVNKPIGPCDQQDAVKYHKELMPLYPELDRNSAYAKEFRRIMSDFYTEVKAHGTPAGQPEVRMAAVKGNYDLCSLTFSGAHRSHPIGGRLTLAFKNPDWFESDPEYSWNIFQHVFFPRPQGIFGDKMFNRLYSGTPYGQIDIVSFALQAPSAQYLLENYKVLLFTGWNTASEEQYRTLCEYVEKGGILFLATPHLAKLTNRKFRTYTHKDLVNQGDFSELCGARITGPGEPFYWVTPPTQEKNCLGVDIDRRYGPYHARMGHITLTDPDHTETLLFEHETLTPLLIRRKKGKGEVFFLNTWDYPGAFDLNCGPNSEIDSDGFIGDIYRYLATLARGSVFTEANEEANFISWSWYPAERTVLGINVDFEKAHTLTLHTPEGVRDFRFAPGEFQRIKL